VKQTSPHTPEATRPAVEAPSKAANTFVTLANLLSLTRIVLIIPFVIVVFSPIPSARLWACIIMGLAVLTDRLDGIAARRYQQATEWGRILDPLADKLAVAALVIVLLVLGLIPIWFAAGLFARDLLILLGGLYLKVRHGLVLPSNTAGKWTVNVIALTLFAVLAGVRSVVVDVFMWVTMAMLLISLMLYVAEFFTVLRGGGNVAHGPS